MTSNKHHKKLNHGRVVNAEFLNTRYERAKALGYSKAKWILFCEALLEAGYKLSLYEARNTYSKYVTVIKDGRRFKVRFSNHKPIKHREIKGDCDFFVGVTNLGTTTTSEALKAVQDFFAKKEVTA